MIVLEQVSVLFIFALLGYVISKKKITDASHAQILSALCIYIFAPCSIFETFAANFTVEYVTQKYQLLLVSAVILIGLVTVCYFAANIFSKKPYERNVYRYSLAIPNFGFMGYALAAGLYGDDVLLDVMVFSLPIQLYAQTVGFCTLTKTKFSFGLLLKPILIAVAAGCVVGLFNWQMPSLVTSILDQSANCLGPVSMILAGITVSEFPLKELVLNVKFYIVSVLRLIVLPCAIALLLRLFGLENMILYALLMYAMPCGMNAVVFPKLVGEDCRIGASLACISSVLGCATIPLCMYLFGLSA